MINASHFIGRVYKLTGTIVKVRFNNGDDEYEDIQIGKGILEDELCIFGYDNEGREYYIATINPVSGNLFDIEISGTLAKVNKLCSLDDLEPIDDFWIDDVL